MRPSSTTGTTREILERMAASIARTGVSLIVDGDRLMFYNAGIDPDSRDLSPGVIFMAERMTPTEAQCTARRFLAAFSPAELTAFVTAESEADLPPSVASRAQSAAQSCLTGK